MATVSIRDLHKKGREVLDRVERGEVLVVTRGGRPVAELRPLPSRSPAPADLIARRKTLPQMDPESLRRDIDSVLRGDWPKPPRRQTTR